MDEKTTWPSGRLSKKWKRFGNFCKEEGPAERRRKRRGIKAMTAPDETKRRDFATERGHRMIVFTASIFAGTSCSTGMEIM
jgi:hypothetical protein